MKKKFSKKIKQNGFSLFELIAVLIILGFIGLGASTFLVYGIDGFLLARANNEVFQKTNIAMGRLFNEAKNLDEIYAINSNSMRYRRDGQAFGLALVGNKLRILRANQIPASGNLGSILMDNVNSFSISFKDINNNNWIIQSNNSLTGLLKIIISMNVAIENTARVFSVEINPFYNNMVNGPTS
ncbi:MAG: prepilin-type N-terminal cleavage/methylation domain-containing protein [Bacteroidetes bacterium]|nr:prepilin-type N-terminal cleavage/methylation domain-containing protein [Bacteroidota bacterium]